MHVTAAYWALYRVARNYPSLVKTHNWQWYLNQAVTTVVTMANPNSVGYVDDGLMDETVFRVLLDDLYREGLTANASVVESCMKARWTIWAGERYPYVSSLLARVAIADQVGRFGSEMAWDSTGQEGVYVWAKYFNDSTTALNVINSIIAYQPTVAHWGYNGEISRV